MGWVKLDDAYFRNKKFALLGRARDQAVKDARLLHLAGACWSAEQLTDGWVPPGAIDVVCLYAGVDEDVVKDLVAIGAWHEPGFDCAECADRGPIEAGWLIHGYLERNRTAEQEKARQAATRERVRRHRAKGNEGSNGVTRRSSRAARTRPPSQSQSSSPSRESRVSEEPLSSRRAADDETTPNDTVSAAFEILARRHLDERNRALKARGGQEVRGQARRRAWLEEDRKRSLEIHGELARRYLSTDPDLTPEDLANLLDDPIADTLAESPLGREP